MDTQMAEKVYVAIGTDPQEAFAALEWTLRKWASSSISIVILFLHAVNNTSKDYAYTPLGRLPAIHMSDEKLEGLRKTKEEENEKLLSIYKAFCGKVKAEILKIEKCKEPLHKLLLELISRFQITKLVVEITVMKSSSGNSHRALSESFHVHHRKPEFCQFFVLCGGKLVFLREENSEGFIEDDQGGRAKGKGTLRDWLGQMKPNDKNLCPTPSSSTPSRSLDQWEQNVEEIERYFHQLISSKSDQEVPEAENETSRNGPHVQENKSAGDKVEMLRIKIRRVHNMIESKKKEAKANVERNARAEWAICLCTRRSEELEARTDKEIATRVDLNKQLDTAEEEVSEVRNEVEGKKVKLNSMLELQRELSNRLQLSSLAKHHVEAELEKAVAKRTEMLCEIEQWRRQRDVLQRRIEFCKEKDAIGMANRLTDLSFECKEFTAEEISNATDNFSDRLRLKSAGDWTNLYRGRLNHAAVAIKMYDSEKGFSLEDFQAEVKVLSQIRHPHLVAMIGFCSEPKSIVFEYMHNGCLRDALVDVPRSSRSSNLNWHARVRMAAQVCSGLAFLHSARARSIAHVNLNPSKILLDRNFVAKIYGLRPSWYHLPTVESDFWAFGNLLLQLLTGRNSARLVDEAIAVDQAHLMKVLDDGAGKWPMDLAMELAGIALRCLSANDGPLDKVLSMTTVEREINLVRKKAEGLVAVRERHVAAEGFEEVEDSIDVPRVFICPIFQDVMKNPHLAADGFSYELEGMEEWFRTGHDTSPMTNLKLNHKLLIPNHALRSLIRDWRNNKSIALA